MSDLEMTRGDEASFAIRVVKSDGTAQSLAGSTLRFTAKRHVSHADAQAVIVATTLNGKIVVTSESGGLATLTIPAEDTDGLTRDVTLVWDLQITDGGAAPHTVDSGDLIVTRDVSRTVP